MKKDIGVPGGGKSERTTNQAGKEAAGVARLHVLDRGPGQCCELNDREADSRECSGR